MNDLWIGIICGVGGALAGVLLFAVLRGSRRARNDDAAGKMRSADIAGLKIKFVNAGLLGRRVVVDDDRRYWVAQGAKWLGETMIMSSLISDRAVNYTWSGLQEGSVELYRKAGENG